jgi:hypothetical protein
MQSKDDPDNPYNRIEKTFTQSRFKEDRILVLNRIGMLYFFNYLSPKKSKFHILRDADEQNAADGDCDRDSENFQISRALQEKNSNFLEQTYSI